MSRCWCSCGRMGRRRRERRCRSRRIGWSRRRCRGRRERRGWSGRKRRCECRRRRIGSRRGVRRRRRWTRRMGRRRRKRRCRSRRRRGRRFDIYVVRVHRLSMPQLIRRQFQIGGEAIEVFVASDYPSVLVLSRVREKRLNPAVTEGLILIEYSSLFDTNPPLHVVPGHARDRVPSQLYLRVARHQRRLKVRDSRGRYDYRESQRRRSHVRRCVSRGVGHGILVHQRRCP